MSHSHRAAPWLRMVAVVAVVAIAAAACSSRGKRATQSTATTKKNGSSNDLSMTRTSHVVVNPLFVSTNAAGKSTGGTEAVTVAIRPSIDGKLRVAFEESEVQGTSSQWQAVGWGAVAVATLLTGAPLRSREIDFSVTGRIDGFSASALLTIAVIALMRGDTLKNDITMTGTINPDGTIGPVGGIPDKVDGVLLAHKKRMLIPEGERNTADGSGNLVDAVSEGRRKGIKVSETPNIYDAYQQFTGERLPRLAASTNTKLDKTAYENIQAKVKSWLAKYSASENDFDSLDPSVQTDLKRYAQQAVRSGQQAKKLSDAGRQAGAFQQAIAAAALMNAASKTGHALQVLRTQGTSAFVSKIKAGQSISGEVTSLVDTLKSFTPSSVSDADALIDSYQGALDAVSYSQAAENLFDANVSSQDEAVRNVTQGAVLYNLAGTLVDASTDIFAVGQRLGGAKLGPNVDIADVARFFRLAAEANFDAFRSVVLQPAADANNASLAVVESRFARIDNDYALARSGDNLVNSLPAYFGSGTTDYAQLGGAISLYERTATLMAKYSSWGQIDPDTLRPTGIANVGAFNSAVQHAQTQLASNIGQLRAQNVSPMIAAADNEVASVERNGTVSDKFDALSSYWDGYVNSRVLAYLGGFPQP